MHRCYGAEVIVIHLFICSADVMTSFQCNNYFIIVFIRTSLVTGDIVLMLLFTYFQFWDGM